VCQSARLDPPAPGPALPSRATGAAIATWIKQDWPRMENSARRRRAWIVFQDESVRLPAPRSKNDPSPRGKTPVLRHHFAWTRVAEAGLERAGENYELCFNFLEHTGLHL
jgi:hypothetical protein